VEFSVSGRSYDASSDILLNLAAPLEMALYNGKRSKDGNEQFGPETGDPTTFESYDEFWTAFTNQLSWIIKQGVTLSEQLAVIHEKIVPSPLLSALFDGPMDKGVDLVSGGARYNASGATNIGFADIVDSLNAIKCVFEDGKYTMEEVITAVSNDFSGNTDREKSLHTYLSGKTRKYGTKDEIDNGESCRLVKFLYDTYQSYTNNRGGKYQSSFWSMTNHSGQGKITNALPNGRKAGKYFASGITPAAGSSKSLTECLNAVAALGGIHMPGGVALNIKFMEVKGEEGIKHLCNFIEGYFVNGGLQIQFNVMSNEKLREALKDKTGKHDDLLVRVSGYSAYFKDLSDHMKAELIERAEYNVQNGKWVE
jgi:formate C-acetyltransferase